MKKGRVVLVTGGSRGLGPAFCRRLGAAGHKIVVNYFNSFAGAEKVVADITAAGGTAKAYKADIRDENEIKQLLDEIAASLGPVEILVNNATGPQPEKPLEQYNWKDFQDQIDFFVKSPFFLLKHLVGPMKKRRWGNIINIVSEVADNCRPNFSPYIAAKTAQLGLTRSWAQELGPWNISVNAVMPGWIPTERHAGTAESEIKKYSATVPMHHMGKPEDVAATVSFLARDENHFVSGQKIGVNGALTF